MSVRPKDVVLDKDSFVRDFRALPQDVRDAFVELVPTVLLAHPNAKRLRVHSLGGFKPTIWKMDVTKRGKMYQATFHMVGATAVFLRICIHKEIDRRPC